MERIQVRRGHVTGALAALGAAVLVVASCSGDQSASQPTTGGEQTTAHQASTAEPVKTSESDWQGVADALGRSGKLASQDRVYRVSFPRKDLSVTSQGVRIASGLALGSYAAFARYSDGTTVVMGDLVVTEEEQPKVTDVLQRNGIEQTALHKHLLEHSPPVWWAHLHAETDNPEQVAQGIKTALDATATPQGGPQAPSESIDLDTGAIDQAMGTSGKNDGGIYKFSFARQGEVTAHGRSLPPAMGVTTALSFQPTGGGQAAISGDFVMTADEVQNVIQALRAGGIQIVALHNHALDDQPRLFYMHFWAHDEATKLAKALREAVDAQAVKPAG
jgi:hypothetical protein